MKYRVLSEPLAICCLVADSRFPSPAAAGEFLCLVRAGGKLSVVCREDLCAEDDLPEGALVERGWLALELQGPFPFSLTGVLASFAQPLAQANIPIFAISTFDTDYVLIKRENLERAVNVLAVAGHEKVREKAG